ncbi:3025_t:CDS:2 [Ambispora leptoticha]|uniref:3025_t:CDS:1 n=1 Tax=Ambispora leptoticha TaxID=144679 RepID=A0A9N9D3L4_9GLOM|nr:3025_t:CDS:2 [Ambispora leptoticha]
MNPKYQARLFSASRVGISRSAGISSSSTCMYEEMNSFHSRRAYFVEGRNKTLAGERWSEEATKLAIKARTENETNQMMSGRPGKRRSQRNVKIEMPSGENGVRGPGGT